MRIRRNAEKSSLMFSHASGAEALQTHVCQLNQSPWDVISFSQDQEACQSSLHLRLEGDDSFSGNGSLGDSIGAVESVASMMVDAEERAAMKMKIDNMFIDNNYEMKGNPEKKGILGEYYSEGKVLKKCDGKGWHCKSEPKQGSSFCDRGLNLLKSYSNASASNHVTACLGPASSRSIKKPEKAATRTRRNRGKSTKKGIPSNPNPYEFYYYSGFGPLWGKRRGDKGEGSKGEGKETETNSAVAAASPSPHDTTPSCIVPPVGHNRNNNGFDYVDEDDDDEEEDSGNGDSSKKRMRKPVKARSLKSLM